MPHPVVKQVQLEAEALLVVGARPSGGKVLASATALSLWGGVDPASGDIIDRYHPLGGENWDGRVLVIPHGRGSCTGSVVLLEAICASHAPALILLNRVDAIIALGAIVADELLQRSVTIAVLNDAVFALALQAQEAHVDADGVLTLSGGDAVNADVVQPQAMAAPEPTLELSRQDERRLAGDEGRARQVAMRIVQRVARLLGATRLIDVTRAHIDACIYTGPAGLLFAQQLADWQGQVAVPTTLNAISIDRRRWQALGVPDAQAQPANSLAEAYVRLGAEPTYTCAPYLLDNPPVAGENIAWAESNAVVFANSVLGARTDKTPDLLDACIALTGRAPLAGYYLDAARRARVVVELPTIAAPDDALYPLLGHLIGARTDPHVPVIMGQAGGWSRDALKAFGAAFATTSSAGMFHIVGVTPEAATLDAALADQPAQHHVWLTHDDLQEAWVEFNGTDSCAVDLVSLGNPHFSVEELAALAACCAGRRKHDAVDVVVTTHRDAAAAAERAGHIGVLERFGVRVITDTCWCMLREPVVPPSARVIVTNSAKYAHYGPGLVGRSIRLASLRGCVDAAVEGVVSGAPPPWLASTMNQGPFGP